MRTRELKVIGILGLVAVVMLSILGLVGCGVSDAEGKPEETSVVEDKNVSVDENKDIKFDDLPNTYGVPIDEDMYLDVPNYQEIDRGYCQVYMIHGSKYMCYTMDLSDTRVKSPEEARDLALTNFVDCIQTSDSVQKVNMDLEEKDTINGIDVIRFEGTCTSGVEPHCHDDYVYGYIFEYEGTANMISGHVISDDQEDSLKKEVRDMADEMMQTVRDQE